MQVGYLEPLVSDQSTTVADQTTTVADQKTTVTVADQTNTVADQTTTVSNPLGGGGCDASAVPGFPVYHTQKVPSHKHRHFSTRGCSYTPDLHPLLLLAGDIEINPGPTRPLLQSACSGNSLNVLQWNGNGIKSKHKEMLDFLVHNKVHVALIQRVQVAGQTLLLLPLVGFPLFALTARVMLVGGGGSARPS